MPNWNQIGGWLREMRQLQFAVGAVAHAFGYNGAFLAAAGVASLDLVQMLVAPPPRRRLTVMTTPAFEIQPPSE